VHEEAQLVGVVARDDLVAVAQHPAVAVAGVTGEDGVEG
jgi:hypothetical protein